MTGSSSSVVKTFPRFPSVKMVERFFNATLAEKMLEKKGQGQHEPKSSEFNRKQPGGQTDQV